MKYENNLPQYNTNKKEQLSKEEQEKYEKIKETIIQQQINNKELKIIPQENN